MTIRTYKLSLLITFVAAITIAGGLFLTSPTAHAGADPCVASTSGPASDALSTEYALPEGICAEEMAVDSNNNLWFTVKPNGHDIVKRSANGTVSVYPLGSNVTAWAPTADNNGNIWFSSYEDGDSEVMSINKITSSGTITTYSATDLGTIWSMTKGPDGNIWFTTEENITKVASNGTMTTYDLPEAESYSEVYDITAGSDGKLWFLRGMDEEVYVGSITTDGSVAQNTEEDYDQYMSITSGPDGNLWITKAGTIIVKMTLAGDITEYPITTENPDVRVLIAGSDGNMWFTEHDAHKLGRISTSGVIVEYDTPTTPSYPRYYAAGSDGVIWYNEANSQIGRLQPSHLSLTTQGGKGIKVVSPVDTDFTCYGTQNSNDVPNDPGYIYPVGLVSYCLNVEEGSTQQLSVTFQTDLSPAEVVLRKYNSNTHQFATVAGAEITQADPIDGHAAVTAVYSVTDGGELDEDGAANGVIVDPVGMAVSAAGAPNTGLGGQHTNQGLFLSLAISGLIVAAGLGVRKYVS